MIFSVYSIKDATIYERYGSLNTGLDAILEVGKTFVNDTAYNSRALVKFDLTKLTDNFTNAVLTQTASYYLRLTATEASEIPLTYTVYAYAVSQSWNMGTGRYTTAVTSSNGVSWKYRLSSVNTGSAWTTASFNSGTTGSWTTTNGGGTWFTASVHSQSFDYSTSDVLMDVTATVREWISGTKSNEGFLVKRSDADEQSTDELGSLRFFSKDTHTIYSPRLEMRYDDSTYLTTATLVSYTDEVALNITNLQPEYLDTAKPRIKVTARPKYPDRSFATSSGYLDNYRLISSSFYSLRDAHTNNVVIPFDESNTKISADANGSYFYLNLDGLAPERYYRLLIKSKINSTEQYIYDKNWIFKVVQ